MADVGNAVTGRLTKLTFVTFDVDDDCNDEDEDIEDKEEAGKEGCRAVPGKLFDREDEDCCCLDDDEDEEVGIGSLIKFDNRPVLTGFVAGKADEDADDDDDSEESRSSWSEDLAFNALLDS